MYRFKSKVAGDLIMMAPVGDQLLRIIGREPAPQGIIEFAALDGAAAALEQAIAADQAARRQGPREGGDDDAPERGGTAVGLQQRAWPMLEMIRRARAEKADIVWGV